MIVVVESKNLDDIKHTIDDVADRLRREPEHFNNVLARFEAGALQRKWLQYVSPRRLQVGLSRVNQYAPILRGDYRPIELDYLYNQLGEQIEGRMEQAADKPLTPAADGPALQARGPVDDQPQRLHRQSGKLPYALAEPRADRSADECAPRIRRSTSSATAARWATCGSSRGRTRPKKGGQAEALARAGGD